VTVPLETTGTTLEIVRLRRQRNGFAAGAAGAVLLTLAVILPPHVRNHREHQRLNAELLALQAAIVAKQSQIKEVQTAILTVQAEIARSQPQPNPN
jgi:hypothetical protein